MTTAPQPADNSANHSSKQEAASVASPTLTCQEQLIIIRKKLAEHTIGSDNNTHRINNPILEEEKP